MKKRYFKPVMTAEQYEPAFLLESSQPEVYGGEMGSRRRSRDDVFDDELEEDEL